jgi:DNA-binding HxlR family transcriptional regulator
VQTDSRTRDVRTQNAAACPVVVAVEQIGTPWRLNVLHALRGGEMRFNELKRATEARSKTLSDALDALVDHGFVERRMEEAAPVAVYYDLTEKGRTLSRVLDDLGEWATEWIDDPAVDSDARPRMPTE